MTARVSPAFFDFFKSFYYSHTYLPQVDLSETALSKHLLERENPQAAATAQRLISQPEVQEILSEPLTYDPETITQKNEQLKQKGFNILSTKKCFGYTLPFYSVVEHPDLPQWIIKSGATRIKEEVFKIGRSNDRNEATLFTEEESLLRIEMADRIAKVAKEANIEVVIPKKKLVSYANAQAVDEPNRKYCILCEKIDILSVTDSIEAIRKMDDVHQREIAKKISTLIQKVGFVDATFNNFRLTPEGKLAFIDTEPAGLLVGKNQGLYKRRTGGSVEKCARIGLYVLMEESSKNIKPMEMDSDASSPFTLQIKSDYEAIATPKLSKWKIALSVFSLGLIPLVQAIIAFVMTKWAQEAHKTLSTMKAAENERERNYINERVPHAFEVRSFASDTQRDQFEGQLIIAKLQLMKEPFVRDFKQAYAPLAKRYYAFINDVPYKEARSKI